MTGIDHPNKMQLRIASDPANIAAARKAVEAFAANHGHSEKAVGEVGLCLNEALANIIRHAYQGRVDQPIEISIDDDENWTRIRLRDWGGGFDPSCKPVQPYDPLRGGGVGLLCLRQLMDEVTYSPQPDGMLLMLGKKKR